MAKSQEELLGLYTELDIPHHDIIERHEFGGALGIPGNPVAISNSSVANPGNAPVPARADHQHAITETWTNYTPTFSGTGWAIGNATVNIARSRTYTKGSQRWVEYEIVITFGSSTTFGSGDLGVSSPSVVVNSGSDIEIGMMRSRCILNESGTERFFGFVVPSGGIATLIPVMNTSSTTNLTQGGGITSSNPTAAIASGDQISLYGHYRDT